MSKRSITLYFFVGIYAIIVIFLGDVANVPGPCYGLGLLQVTILCATFFIAKGHMAIKFAALLTVGVLLAIYGITLLFDVITKRL